MPKTDAYQDASDAKSIEVASNQQKIEDMISGKESFSKAVHHLNKSSERGAHAPKLGWNVGSEVAQ